MLSQYGQKVYIFILVFISWNGNELFHFRILVFPIFDFGFYICKIWSYEDPDQVKQRATN